MIERPDISILIVDDEEDIRDVLEIALLDLGYKVFTADNGQSAFDVFKDAPTNVVITDIKMPVMDGIQLLRKVKDHTPDTEVIMITGHGDMDLSIASLKNHAADFITKPVNVDVLEISVAKAVEKITAKRQLAEYTQRLEELIMEKTDLASHLSSLGLMMGTVSHNIKGLLTNLDGGIYLTRSGMKKQDTASMEDGLAMLSQAVDRIKKMVMDVLLYSKERKLEIVPVPTREFALQVQKTMAPKLKSTDILFKCQDALAPETIPMDREFMLAALINILDNAVDACLSDKAKTDHEIRCDIEKKDRQAMIRITDNGCGMDPAIKEKIFDLFFSSKGTQGTGFGLYISNSVIKQHGGTISVMSVKGKETVFTIVLPC